MPGSGDIYSDLNDKRLAYFEFFASFKEHLVEYIKLNHPKTLIFEMGVGQVPVTLYKDIPTTVQVQIKNQGESPVYITTDKKSGYRLDPSEFISLTINHPISFVCPDGNSHLGFIQH